MVFFNALEEFVIGYFKTSSVQEAMDILSHHLGTEEYFARLLIIFTCFIPFFAFKELARVIGHKKIIALFFKRESNM
jgi:hypothetical protein